ncbi:MULTISPECIES: hypothetical protein [Paenibacillus]|uniref:hypothetical protein n=1 Tax=Paenibacillus TaxID=44249 RepID=UPI0006A70F3F|nr:hypothetical protein [Paenibacillus peoriae]ALA40565.1 hypothetical protein ABE82_03050 [Paenibacillus peoriae]OMF23833.1 hypothetical protein BK134_26505 [Paenibacillus peoriae]
MVKKIMELITNASVDGDDGILVAALKLLKNQCNLEELEGDYYIQLVNMISLVKVESTKALLIETIVESPDYVTGNEFLDEYVGLLSRGATNVEEAARCLGAFTAAGSTNNEIFLQLAENLDHEFAIEILVSMGRSKWGDVPSHLESFARRVQIAQRIRYRSAVIGAFLLIVHPLCSEYAHISSLSFGYPFTESAVNDWAWVTPKNTEKIVAKKIVTPKEADVLVKLGGLLRSNVNLNLRETKKLYAEFFEDKNPFDVIYTLPE